MHSAWIAAIPPDDFADVDIAGTSFGFGTLDECVHAPFLGAGHEMQSTVDHNGFLAAHVSFGATGRRIFCVARLRVRDSNS